MVLLISAARSAAISSLKFPFHLNGHQLYAVDAWISSGMRGSIIYSSGTGKTEIAFECARRAAAIITLNKQEAGPGSPFLPSTSSSQSQPFDIVFLVPRIVLISQNLKRLIDYGISREKIGVYFAEQKEINKEITISTYQSVIRVPSLIRKSKMVVFDEVHLVSDSAKVLREIFDVVVEDHTKALLGLTATINEKSSKYNTIVTVLPPVKKYLLKEAVEDGRLTRPVVIPIKVNLTEEERKLYDVFSTKIKNVSDRFKRYDANSMISLLKKGGFASGMAKAWFSNVRKRKVLLACADNKISAVVDLILRKHANQRIMVFSETLDSINKLKSKLESEHVSSTVIDSRINSLDRQKILSGWGKDFYVLLSVHTLEIGYDVPEVGVEIILATTSNINQVIQRIGRIVRKYEGKKKALIYVVYVCETKDDGILEIVRKAVGMDERTPTTNREPEDLRIKRAYNILELNSYEPTIIKDANHSQKLFSIRSGKEKDKFYEVNTELKTCSCPDFEFKALRCKHIIAAETTKS
ncbi:MAG TPA: helicase-related protein [Nitrososphaeraceae archaeon]